jgi:hypothetical protein
MSYDSIKDHNRRAAKDWRTTPVDLSELLDDVERGAFLRMLGRSKIELSRFESGFLDSFFTDYQLNWWTPGRREVCDCLRKTYGGRL